MKNITCMVILFFSISKFSVAQITFQKTYGGTSTDWGHVCYQTNDGGYIIAGETFTFGAGLADFYLIKTDSEGTAIWMKTFGGTINDATRSMQPTSDGGYIISGFTESYGAGSWDVLLVKTDSNGNAMWSKTYGGAGYEYASCVKQTSDGGYIIAGYTVNFGPSNGNVYLIKTDANGDSLWIRTFSGNNSYEFHSVEQTTDGGYILGGTINNFVAGSNNVCLIKCDSTGIGTWMKSFGGSDNDNAYYALQTTDGGFIITGGTFSFGAGMNDVLVIKTDSVGTVLWTKTYGGINNEQGQHIQQTNDNGYIITGFTYSYGTGMSDVLLIKTDSSGNILWTKTFGGADYNYGEFVKQTNDSGYIITGLTGNLGTVNDIYLIKTDANGNSGCNESSPIPVVAIPALQDTGFIAITYSGSIVTSPAIISGSGGTETTICTSVGMNEAVQNDGFILYPNPFIDEIKIIYLKNTVQIILTIQNILGQTVFYIKENNLSSNYMKTIDLSLLSKGIYLLEVILNGERTVKKIVKE